MIAAVWQQRMLTAGAELLLVQTEELAWSDTDCCTPWLPYRDDLGLQTGGIPVSKQEEICAPHKLLVTKKALLHLTVSRSSPRQLAVLGKLKL